MNVFRPQQQAHDYAYTLSSSSQALLTQMAPPGPVIQTTSQELSQKRARKSPRSCAIKNRKIMNSVLKYVGQQVNKELSLCDKGICYFQCNQFMIVIEVPDKSDSVFLYSMVFGLRRKDDRGAILEKCMQLNYMKHATRGSTLGLNGDEMNLCFSCPVSGLTRDSFVEALENFIVTALQVNTELELIRG